MLAVAIVGVLAVIASGQYTQYRERTLVVQAVLDIGAIESQIGRYQADNRVRV